VERLALEQLVVQQPEELAVAVVAAEQAVDPTRPEYRSSSTRLLDLGC